MELHPYTNLSEMSRELAALTEVHSERKQKETIPYWFNQSGVMHIVAHKDTVREEILAVFEAKKIDGPYKIIIEERTFEKVKGLDELASSEAA